MERDARLWTSRFFILSEVVISGLLLVVLEEIGVIGDQSFRSYPHEVEEEVFEVNHDFLHFVVIYFIVIEIHHLLLYGCFRSKDFGGSYTYMLGRDGRDLVMSGGDEGASGQMVGF